MWALYARLSGGESLFVRQVHAAQCPSGSSPKIGGAENKVASTTGREHEQGDDQETGRQPCASSVQNQIAHPNRARGNLLRKHLSGRQARAAALLAVHRDSLQSGARRQPTAPMPAMVSVYCSGLVHSGAGDLRHHWLSAPSIAYSGGRRMYGPQCTPGKRRTAAEFFPLPCTIPAWYHHHTLSVTRSHCHVAIRHQTAIPVTFFRPKSSPPTRPLSMFIHFSAVEPYGHGSIDRTDGRTEG